jgi:hypothetical protein
MKTFEEFWPFYLGEHRDPTNRRLHFVGSTLVLATVAAAVATGHLRLLALTPVLGYGFAWVGHFLIEKNRPATFTYPVWSFAGDWKMWWMTLTGRLDGELSRLSLR